MFVNSVNVINNKLENITLNIPKMQPKSERPPVCPKSEVPQLHLTPTAMGQMGQKKVEEHQPQNPDDLWLLKPQHDIPPTPPPQTDPKPLSFFQQGQGSHP